MSRARAITFPDGTQWWYDTHRNGQKAPASQLELLAVIANDCELDDLLDEALTQWDVVTRLRALLGQGCIPSDVLERRERWRSERRSAPQCRICDKEGDSTKHHFINRWILRELEHYASQWADRSKNCIPLCIECHRDLHQREAGDKSIAPYLTDTEKRFAHDALRALIYEKPKLFDLICEGDAEVSYEACLIKDWVTREFRVETDTAQPVRLAA